MSKVLKIYIHHTRIYYFTEKSELLRVACLQGTAYDQKGAGQTVTKQPEDHRSSSDQRATAAHHTALLPFIPRSSARMTPTGSGGDSLGSVASCPGLRVQYW